MKQALFIIMFVVAALAAAPRSASASCYCTSPETVEAGINQVDAVFVGKVVPTQDGRRTLEVSGYWKGDVPRTVILAWRLNDCTPFFRRGEEYVVYAFVKNGVWTTTNCTRTRQRARAEKDLAELGPAKIPAR